MLEQQISTAKLRKWDDSEPLPARDFTIVALPDSLQLPIINSIKPDYSILIESVKNLKSVYSDEIGVHYDFDFNIPEPTKQITKLSNTSEVIPQHSGFSYSWNG